MAGVVAQWSNHWQLSQMHWVQSSGTGDFSFFFLCLIPLNKDLFLPEAR